MVIALIHSGEVNLTRWLPHLPCRGQQAQSKQRRLSRWLHNSRINTHRLYKPLIQAALADWQEDAIYLSLDTSMFWDEYCLVRLAVVHRGRALPVVWRVLEHPSASIAFAYSLSGKNINKKAKEIGQPNVSLELEAVSLGEIDDKQAIAREIALRKRLEKEGQLLPWDNTNRRLGRSGPGVPYAQFSRSQQKQGYRWNNEGHPVKDGKTGDRVRVDGPPPKEVVEKAFVQFEGNAELICKHFGIERSTLSGWQTRYALSLKDFIPNARPPESTGAMERLLRKYNGNLSEIAEAHNRDYSTVQSWCSKFGLQPRNFCRQLRTEKECIEAFRKYHTLEKVAEAYKVSESTIRHWLKKLNRVPSDFM